MNYEHIIIDGYNLMYQDQDAHHRRDNLMTARQFIVRKIEKLAGGMAGKITVVFDGRESGVDVSLTSAQIEVLFSPANRTADGVIEQMVHDAETPETILVVTSDWIEQRLVSVFGATVISCREFLLRYETAEPLKKSFGAKSRNGQHGQSLGDFFPES